MVVSAGQNEIINFIRQVRYLITNIPHPKGQKIRMYRHVKNTVGSEDIPPTPPFVRYQPERY